MQAFALIARKEKQKGESQQNAQGGEDDARELR
jgi:hypothetical protein